MVMPIAPCFFRRAFSARYIAADVSSVSRVTPSTFLAACAQRSATARVSSLSACCHASLTSANGMRSTLIPIISGAGPEVWSRTARILASFNRRTHSPGARHLTGSAWPANRPARGVLCSRSRAVAATNSEAAPPCFTTWKHFTASTKSFDLRGSDEPDVGRLAAEEGGVVNEEAAAAAVLEIGVEHRLAGSCDRLHHAVPAVHLVNQVAIDIPGDFILFDELLGLLLTGGQRRDKLKFLALIR